MEFGRADRARWFASLMECHPALQSPDMTLSVVAGSMEGMKLNHLNICTSDPNAAAEFFVKYFAFERAPTGMEDTICVVRDETGFVLLFSNFSKKAAPVYPDGFHFGFILETREAVNRMYERLQADGHASQPPRMLHGSWTFYFTAPGNFLLEMQCAGA
jgi:catechol 2,3-dioxygenase-like lactoylglutathione lyase family enzyme